MVQQVMAKCSACDGTGSQIAASDRCTTCHGEKTVKEKKTLEVFITKGMRHGERMTFKGEADEAVSGRTQHTAQVFSLLSFPFFP